MESNVCINYEPENEDLDFADCSIFPPRVRGNYFRYPTSAFSAYPIDSFSSFFALGGVGLSVNSAI